MTSCLKRRDLSWLTVFLLTFVTSLATSSNQIIRAHVNQLNLSYTICYGKEPISIPIEKIQKELDELSEIERDIDNVRTAKLSDDPDKSIKYYYIDFVAIADYSLYKSFSGDRLKIRTQIAHLFFGAKRVYLQNQFSIPEMFDFKIVLNLVDIIIVESSEESILYKIREGPKKSKVDVDKGVRRIMDFKYEGSYDHITLFTALDLAVRDDDFNGQLNSAAVGFANGPKMCYPHMSISIVEHQWRGFDMLTLVHEIGHSLGAKHDGEQNNCSARDDFLMAAVENGYSSKERTLNKWTFSECSRKEIASYILKQYNGAYVKYLEGVYDNAGQKYTESEKAADSQYMADCFTKKIPIKEYVPDVSKRFQGSDYNFAEQCTLRGYEPPGRACQGRNPEQQSCYVRYCNMTEIFPIYNIINYECKGIIPYRGTRCGTDKVCEAGFCRSIEELKNLKMSFSSNLTAPFGFTPSPLSSTLEPVSSTLEPVSSTLEPVSSSLEKEKDPEPMNSSHCLHDYGLNLVIVRLLVCGTLTL